LEIGKPGFEYFAGTHINPNITWWNKAGSFMDYLGRCQYMLTKGKFVADVCCYVVSARGTTSFLIESLCYFWPGISLYS
jgi:hypothetical protein